MLPSGQFAGLLLSRTLSGLLAELWGWRSIYAYSAVAMVGVAGLLLFCVPTQRNNE
jgi:MFS family permease